MNTNESLVKVGFEIEVVRFKTGETYSTVSQKLVEQGFMVNDRNGWTVLHDYGCNCETICRRVRSGDVYHPPMVSLTYDASLPETGGEFVTSAMIVDEEFLNEFKKIWETISTASIWNNTDRNRRGDGYASPGFHVHTSVAKAYVARMNHGARGIQGNRVMEDASTVLTLFAPELFQIASLANNWRGLYYRMPLRFTEGDRYGHHGFVQVRSGVPRQSLYVEWRLWEMEYEDWDYVLGVTYISAALTRALTDPGNISTLMALAWSEPYSETDAEMYAEDNNLEGVLSLVSATRMRILQELILNELHDDALGRHAVSVLFERINNGF